MRQKPKRIFRVAVIIPAGNKPHQDRIKGILRYAATRPDWDLFLFGTHSDSTALDDLSDWHADGIITVPEFFNDRMMKGALRARAYAIANGRDIQPPHGCENFGAIVCDNFAVGRTGARFLLQKHHRNFAYIGMPKSQTWSQDRMVGFRDELAAQGFGCSVFSSSSGRGWASEEKALAEFLTVLPKPCGILAAVDSRAKHVLDVCRLIGISVPEQISVLGVDNEEMTCEWTQPSLSSILPEFEESGFRLAKMLDTLMRGHAVRPRKQTYGITGIIERRSTLDLSGSARLISRAREYIRTHAASGLSVEDIARAAGCSARILQRHFRNVLGKTPIEELRDRRLDLVCEKLQNSETPIDAIGEFCGFNAVSYLKAAFKERFGYSMSDWRKRARRPSSSPNKVQKDPARPDS